MSVYAAEPDRLFWFASESHPALGGVLQTLLQADTLGLDPADYDALPLAKRWQAMSGLGSGSKPRCKAIGRPTST